MLKGTTEMFFFAPGAYLSFSFGRFFRLVYVRRATFSSREGRRRENSGLPHKRC